MWTTLSFIYFPSRFVQYKLCPSCSVTSFLLPLFLNHLLPFSFRVYNKNTLYFQFVINSISIWYCRRTFESMYVFKRAKIPIFVPSDFSKTSARHSISPLIHNKNTFTRIGVTKKPPSFVESYKYARWWTASQGKGERKSNSAYGVLLLPCPSHLPFPSLLLQQRPGWQIF